MAKHTIYADLTLRHSYRAGWNYLNDTLPAFAGRMTKPRLVANSSDGDSWDQSAVITLSPGQLAYAKRQYQKYRAWAAGKKVPTFTRFLEGAAGDYFVSGCRCEYDCCGHTQSYARAKRIGRRTLMVRIHNYLNV